MFRNLYTMQKKKRGENTIKDNKNNMKKKPIVIFLKQHYTKHASSINKDTFCVTLF